jgi:protein YIPF6
MFAAVFTIVWVGAVVVTLNTLLLGGNVSFFQCVCIMGYSIAPLNIAVIINFFLSLVGLDYFIVKFALIAVAFGWSLMASLGFLVSLVPSQRRMLSLYPLILFYAVLSWLILLQ